MANVLKFNSTAYLAKRSIYCLKCAFHIPSKLVKIPIYSSYSSYSTSFSFYSIKGKTLEKFRIHSHIPIYSIGPVLNTVRFQSTDSIEHINPILHATGNTEQIQKSQSAESANVNLSTNANVTENIQLSESADHLQNVPSQSAEHLQNSVGITEEIQNVVQAADVSEQSVLENYIPEVPPVPEVVVSSTEQVSTTINTVQELIASQGGSWTPVGFVEQALEYLHVTFNIPWWGSIAIGTLVVRLLMSPLTIYSQRIAVNMNNNMPQMQAIQLKLTQARQSGDQLEAARYAHELMAFMGEKSLNPFKSMIVPLCQAPVFITFFLSLRELSNLPLEGLKTGGIYWFSDLTIPDPYYLLPICTSLTLYFTIRLSADGSLPPNAQVAGYIMRALPFIIFPFIMNFSSAILCYWVTSNFIGLGQVAILKLEPVRNFCKIPKKIRHEPEKLPMKKKGFIEGTKDAYANLKITKDIEDRARIDQIAFKKAGTGPIQKTYRYDPTKQNTVAAKKR